MPILYQIRSKFISTIKIIYNNAIYIRITYISIYKNYRFFKILIYLRIIISWNREIWSISEHELGQRLRGSWHILLTTD